MDEYCCASDFIISAATNLERWLAEKVTAPANKYLVVPVTLLIETLFHA